MSWPELSGSRPRTATLIAASESVTLKIDQSTLRELVGGESAFWRSAADIVAERLDERNLKVGFANEHPTAFVISSSEGSRSCETRPQRIGLCEPARSTLE